MKRSFEKLGSVLKESPAIWSSIVCCCWAYIRIMLYVLGISGSRASLEELTLVTLLGAVTALIAILRDREQAWYLGGVTMVLNGAAWWLGLMQVNWAAMFSS